MSNLEINSSLTALIIQKQKQKFGYTLHILTPLEGFLLVQVNISKKITHQIIEPFNLVELSFNKRSSTKQNLYPQIKEIDLIFSFTPPYMEYFHFFGLQGLLLQFKKIFYQSKQEENQTFFVMLSTLLKLSQSIKTKQESQKLLLSLFFKWNLILKFHEEILYCSRCAKKLIGNKGFAEPLFLESPAKIICSQCELQMKEHTNLLQIDYINSIWEIIYLPFEVILIQTQLSTQVLEFLNHYIQVYFRTSIQDLFAEKNNPFLDL